MPQIFNVCDRQLLKRLLMIPTSWYSRPGIIPSPKCGEDLVTCFLQIKCHESDRMSLLRWSCRRTLASILLILSCSLTCPSDEGQLPYCELPCTKVYVAKGREGDLQLTTNSNRADCYPEISLTAKSSQQPHAWAWKHILPLSHLKTTSAPWLQSGPPRCKDNKWLLFKLLNLGVICYAAIDN